MYRVVLVDDEPWNLQGLEQLLDWNAEEFTIALSTTDPLEAMQYIKREAPDLLIADIRMPGMTGIELVKQIRASGIEIECVILSGYSDFSYAQDAIRADVMEYCLKPMKAADLTELLGKLRTRLFMRESTAKSRFEFLLDNPELLPATFDGTSFAVVLSGDSSLFGDEQDGMLFRYAMGKSRFAYLVDAAVVPRLAGRDDIAHRTGVSAVHAVSHSDVLITAYGEARIAEATAFIDPSIKLHFYHGCNVARSNEVAGQIIAAASRRDENGLKEFLKDMDGLFIRYTLTIRDLEFVWNRLAAHILSTEGRHPDAPLPDYLDFEQILEQFESFGEFRDYIYAQLIALYAEPMTAQTLEHAQFKKLVQYIDEHYNEGLMLKDLAERFFFNPNYCCLLFKKYINLSFSEYLKSIRIRQAKLLLKGCGHSISEVAGMVGFSDYYYFNKVFKKETGLTPKSYRALKRGSAI